MDFSNCVALITGASSGIGKEFAKQIHAKGASLILLARRLDLLEELKSDLEQTRPNSVRSMKIDLTKDEQLQEVYDFIKKNHIDLLINNAGYGSFGCFENLDIKSEIDQVKLNIIATQKLAHAVIPQMKSRGSGGIISVSSIAAFQPIPYMATYSATKSFNFIHSIALRHELKKFNVHVLTLCPGPTETEFGGVARVPGQLSGGKRDSVEMVVSKTLGALSKNKAYIIPGARSFFLSLLVRFLPIMFTTSILEYELFKTLRASQLADPK